MLSTLEKVRKEQRKKEKGPAPWWGGTIFFPRRKNTQLKKKNARKKRKSGDPGADRPETIKAVKMTHQLCGGVQVKQHRGNETVSKQAALDCTRSKDSL